MRVAVLGAAGTIGPAIVADLGRSDEVSELLLLDLHKERAETVAAQHGFGKARGAAVDATARSGEPGDLAEAIRDWDALVNSASYRVNLRAMEACLEAGCHYLDLGGLYHVTAQQLHRFAVPDGDRFADAGLLAVLGIGSAPGKTNLMATRALRELVSPDFDPLVHGRERDAGSDSGGSEAGPVRGVDSGGSEAGPVRGVDSLHVSAAGRDLDPPSGFSPPYAVRTLIDELTLKPIVIRNGGATEIEPLSDAGAVDFGDPIGEANPIYTLHSEMLTFAESFGCREGSFRLSLAPRVLERLRELVESSPEEVERAASEVAPPSPNTVAVHLVEASKGGRSVRVRSVTRPVEEFGLGGGVVSTAAPAAATVRLLATGKVTRRGVMPPERCLDPDDLFPELEQRGSKFDIEGGREAVAEMT